jgi:inner membrane protein
MDSFTHVLAGGVIAKSLEDERIGNWGTLAGLSMGFFPDSDFVLGLFNRQFAIQYHRDFTHSLLLIPFYALLFGWIFFKLSKRPHFWVFFRVCFLVLISHVLLDLFTSYGTMIFSPFFKHRYALDLLFIVDLIFSGILLIPWGVSLFWKKRGAWICRGSVIAATIYVLFCWAQHRQAIESTKRFGESLKEEVVEVASLPQPLSPFRWANYAETKDTIYQGFVDLRKKKASSSVHGSEAPLESSSFLGRWRVFHGLYQPRGNVRYHAWQKLEDSPWVKKAIQTDGARFYFWFARFPIVRSVNSNNGGHRVEFTDARFLVPSVRLPFVYHMEFDDSGRIQSEGFTRER